MKKRFFKGAAMALALMLCGASMAEVRTTGDVWMRLGPGLGYDPIASIATGKTLDYLGETSVDDRGVAWYKVSVGDNTGWVSSRYSELIGESSESAAESTSSDEAPEAEATQAPASLPALAAGLLFGDGDAEAKPSQDPTAAPTQAPAPAQEEEPASAPSDGLERSVEISGYYLSDLVETANGLGLFSYRQVESEAPYQYYNDSLIIAGKQLVENIVIYGEGYELYGVYVGMNINAARACLNAAGLDYKAAANGFTYEHRATEGSLFADAAGHDSCINVWVDETDTVTEIDWSSYTG